MRVEGAQQAISQFKAFVNQVEVGASAGKPLWLECIRAMKTSETK